MWKSLGWSSAVASACLVLATGCGGDPEQNDETAAQGVARLDDRHFLGEPVAIENLTVWPVFTDAPLEIGEFLTLKDAQEQKLAVVRELGGERVAARQQEVVRARGAIVGTLEIENSGDLPILVCAGTVLKGGNQDRQIAQDFVVPAKSRVPVDAFCVEHGRWTALRHGKPTDGEFSMASAMAPKAVRAMGQYERNQQKVWQEVADVVYSRAPARVGTSLALSIDEADASAREVERRLAEQVRTHFVGARDLGQEPVGFAYAIDGKLVTVRTFAHARIFKDHLDAFIDSMCMEADIAQRRAARQSGAEKTTFEPASARDVVALVNALQSYDEQIEKTAAANSNGYRKGDLGFQSSCYVDLGKERIALTQDWTAR